MKNNFCLCASIQHHNLKFAKSIEDFVKRIGYYDKYNSPAWNKSEFLKKANEYLSSGGLPYHTPLCV